MQNTPTLIRNAGIGLFAIAALVACDNATDNQVSQGIASLGSDFVRAFNQSPNDTPIPLDDVNLVLTQDIEPFNP